MVAYVSQKSFETAQGFEKRLRDVVSGAGFIFVSVQAQAEEGGECWSFDIIVGVDRKFEVATAEAVVKKTFEKEIEDGNVELTVRVFRGSRAAAGHEALQRPATPSA